MTTFAEILPRLVAAYDKGVLVPFLGAGMSRDTCPEWEVLVKRLEDLAGVVRQPATADKAQPTESATLVRRSNQAVRRICRNGTGSLGGALRTALYGTAPAAEPSGAPDQTVALARIPWPLVLTTNYDDLFVRAYTGARLRESERAPLVDVANQTRDLIEVLGRSPADCHRVLASLDTTSPTILWALQGYLPQIRDEETQRLEGDLVVGHAEYRRVTHTQEHFRRSFAEVFRRRSFLFLGSGLEEPYFVELFGEVLELLGPNPRPHFALVKRSPDLDVNFLRTRLNIIAAQFERFDELPGQLAQLGEAIAADRARPVSWSFGLGATEAVSSNVAARDLEIVSGGLTKTAEGECTILSAGFMTDDVTPYLSPPIVSALANISPPFLTAYHERRLERKDDRIFVFKQEGARRYEPVVAVAPWKSWDQRDLSLIGAGLLAALSWARDNGFKRGHAVLLGAGSSRHFHPRFSLVEMTRAFKKWRQDAGNAVDLTIHVVDDAVKVELVTGKLDVLELLSTDDLQISVEVVDQDDVEREVLFKRDDATLGEICSEFAIAQQGWALELRPSVTPEARQHDVSTSWNATIRGLGVLSGATMRFVRTDASRDSVRARDDATVPASMVRPYQQAMRDAPQRPISGPHS